MKGDKSWNTGLREYLTKNSDLDQEVSEVCPEKAET